MEWIDVGTITTNSEYVYTPVVSGTLFKLKHLSASSLTKKLKVVIKQAFDDNGITTFFDSRLISCKQEQDVLIFNIPRGLANRKLAIKRVDSLLNESWTIEIKSLELVEDGVTLPITISDVTDLQQRLDTIQAELTLKALDLDLDGHTANINNPHNTTALQVGADPAGSATASVVIHEETTNHPVASATAKGMMGAADKSKLDAIAPGATVNSSDTYLLNRTNHEGTQPVNTIEGLTDFLSNLADIYSNQEIGGSKIFTNATLFRSAVYTYLFFHGNGYYYNDTPANLEIKRDISTTSNDYVEIGYFSIEAGGVILRANLVISNPGFSLAKTYEITTSYSLSDTGWLRAIPIKSSVYSPNDDCELDVRLNTGFTVLRLRRSGGIGYSGVARLRLEFLGDSTTEFTQTFATGNDPSVTGNYQ